ncbi:alpha/beta hydrolase [Archangium lansingense]|uniref:Alpha/beta hydrolase n=1 Tax=Archangium lansingense TaxID=2995310 RepID=A0ABT4AJF3_9BACT|nr:alpha/beta hydrolase [Archangium lansinium]MCY1081411.1 alpha/beta hydrolase [Archangium lansinium]
MRSSPETPTSSSVSQGRPRRRWLRRLLWMGLGLAFLLATGTVYQAVSAAADARNFPPPGRMVDVGGHRLHLHCIGEGRPTVVLETGANGMSSGWAWVQPEVAKATRVCSYDRAGTAWSEPGQQPHDAAHVAEQLHTLLANAGESGPFVLVGHSLGGLFVRLYADRYPGEVAGMVLLDASHPDQMQRLPQSARTQLEVGMKVMAIAPALIQVGLARATGLFAAIGRGLPERAFAEVAAFASTPQHLAAAHAEMLVWEDTVAQVRATRNLGELPLLVVSAGSTAGAGEELLPAFHAMHREMVALSSRGEYRLISEANHISLVTDASHARQTSAAILDVVNKVRASSKAEAVSP